MLSNCLPHADNFTYLRKNTFEALKESLTFFCKESGFISDEHTEEFSSIINKLSLSSPFFPFMMLNHILTENYEDKDQIKFRQNVQLFLTSYKMYSGTLRKVIPYGHQIFSSPHWHQCDAVIKNSFSETVTLAPPNAKKFSETSMKVRMALENIKRVSPIVHEEIETFITTYMIVHSNRFVAGSSFPLIGLVGLSDAHSIDHIIDLMVHENAHQYIYHLTVFDEVCQGEGMFQSPLREDARPLEAIYHATFVLARLIYFYQLCEGMVCFEDQKKAKTLLQTYHLKFKDGYKTLKAHAIFTPLGEKLLDSCWNVVC